MIRHLDGKAQQTYPNYNELQRTKPIIHKHLSISTCIPNACNSYPDPSTPSPSNLCHPKRTPP